MTDMVDNGLSCDEARERFDDILRRVIDDRERVVLSRDGRPIAAVVPIEDLEFFEAIEDQLDAEEARRAKEEFLRSGEPAIPWEKIKADLGL
jgi:prevent-host-death family protein